MHPFSSRIGRPPLIGNLTTLVRSAVNRFVDRMARRRTEKPIKQAGQTVQAELEQRLSAMQQTVDQQALLLRMTVHDLRMPLSSIQGYTDLLLQGIYGTFDADQAAVLQKIAYSALSLDRLLSGLLDTMSAEVHTLSLAREAFDPSELARNVLEDCYPQAVRQGLTLQFRSMGDPRTLVGDPYRVRQMLFNLLGNALRYTAKGGIRLIVEARVDGVEFRVEDTGVGIPQELQDIIWKPFARATSKGEGLGIGLYTVHQLTQAMGGSVGLHSTLGKGSVFWIQLPYGARAKAIGDTSSG